MTALIATSLTSRKMIILDSDLENSEHHKIFGNYELSDDEKEYLKEELGEDEYELEVIESDDI